jgi:hypothetical protein
MRKANSKKSFNFFLMTAVLGATTGAIATASQSAAQTLRQANNSSLIRLEGFSDAEQTRVVGFLRSAAYGESAPGAMRYSNSLHNNLADEDDGCFIPERFSMFKATTDRDPCKGLGTLLIADTATQILYLCKNGKSVRDFDFAKGWGGTGKRQEGDERTPLGVYSIKAPQKSASGFHKFIHIGYPTSFQKKEGYTGSNVGIHGPSRWARCLGRLNTYFNWTNGCLAVASDRDMDEVSRFVEENSVNKLAVYPLEETGSSLEK